MVRCEGQVQGVPLGDAAVTGGWGLPRLNGPHPGCIGIAADVAPRTGGWKPSGRVLNPSTAALGARRDRLRAGLVLTEMGVEEKVPGGAGESTGGAVRPFEVDTGQPGCGCTGGGGQWSWWCG